MNRIACGALGAAALALLAGPALAHATLAVTEATPESTYRGVVRVGHGCEGSPTTRLSVKIPDGVVNVKPMPKPGWTLETRRGSYPRTYTLWGKPVSEGVTEVSWSGSLSDDHYDEFVFTARITDAVAAGTTIYFPVTQGCEKGSHAWTEIPAAGQDAHALKEPAPGVRIVAASGRAAPAPDAVRAGNLVIETPWARATPGGAKVAGGYLRIRNEGKEPDRLVGASIPLAKRGEVHEMSMDGGIMKMREVEGGLAIPAGGTVELKPGGFHLMFMDLAGGLKEGETVKGALVFEKAGTVPVAFKVGGLGAQAPGGSAGAHQHH